MPSLVVKDANSANQTIQTLPATGQAPSANSLPVVVASDQGAVPADTVVKGTAANRSGTITTGGTAQQLMAANASRRGFRIQNQSNGALYFSATGTATMDQNSFLLNAGDYFESSPHFIGTTVVSIIGATTGQAYHATEF